MTERAHATKAMVVIPMSAQRLAMVVFMAHSCGK